MYCMGWIRGKTVNPQKYCFEVVQYRHFEVGCKERQGKVRKGKGKARKGKGKTRKR